MKMERISIAQELSYRPRPRTITARLLQEIKKEPGIRNGRLARKVGVSTLCSNVLCAKLVGRGLLVRRKSAVGLVHFWATDLAR